jgi:hypothetical protein
MTAVPRVTDEERVASRTRLGDRHRRRAATILLVTSLLWLHEWLPLMLVATWVSWLLLHKRLEGDLGDAIVRAWRRAWPPPTLVLIPPLATSALAYWLYVPVPGKILPIALDMLGLSLLLLGDSWALLARRGWLRPAPGAAAAPVSAPG